MWEIPSNEDQVSHPAAIPSTQNHSLLLMTEDGSLAAFSITNLTVLTVGNASNSSRRQL